MKYSNKIWLNFVFLLSPISCFAAFCPSNFNQINVGDTMDQVVLQCGRPDTQDETKRANENVPQEWSFFIPQTVATAGMQPMQGTLRTQMTFDASGKAINISVNGIGVGSTTICGGRTISLGDSREQIKSACGDPSFVNKQNTPGGGGGNAAGPEQGQIKVTTFIYNSNPPVKLIFENGVLKSQQ